MRGKFVVSFLVLLGLVIAYWAYQHVAVKGTYNFHEGRHIIKKKVGKQNLTIIEGDPKPIFLNEDFREVICRALTKYGTYCTETNLPDGHCFYIDNGWDSEGQYVSIQRIEMKRLPKKDIEILKGLMNVDAQGRIPCHGDEISEYKIGTKSAVNIRGKRCICGNIRVNIKTWEIRWDNIGGASIQLELRKMCE